MRSGYGQNLCIPWGMGARKECSDFYAQRAGIERRHCLKI